MLLAALLKRAGALFGDLMPSRGPCSAVPLTSLAPSLSAIFPPRAPPPPSPADAALTDAALADAAVADAALAKTALLRGWQRYRRCCRAGEQRSSSAGEACVVVHTCTGTGTGTTAEPCQPSARA